MAQVSLKNFKTDSDRSCVVRVLNIVLRLFWASKSLEQVSEPSGTMYKDAVVIVMSPYANLRRRVKNHKLVLRPATTVLLI